MLKTGELLGVDAETLAQKCANFSAFYGVQLMEGSEDRQKIIDRVSTSFTHEDLLFLSIQFLHEKTMDVIREQITQRFAKAKTDAENSVSSVGSSETISGTNDTVV